MLQHQLWQRIQKMKTVIGGLCFRREEDNFSIEHKFRDEGEYTAFQNGGVWALGAGEHWENFRFTCTVPDDFYGQPTLCVHTAMPEHGGKPQFVVWVNGKIETAFDNEHTYLILSEKAKPGEKFDILLEAYHKTEVSGGIPVCPHLRVCLSDRMDDVCQLYYDIALPHGTVELLPEDDREREKVLYTLSDALNLVDLREPFSDAFHASVQDARAFMKTNYYDTLASEDPKVVADCIGHSHIDVAWRWDLYQTRHKAVRTFSTMLNLMERYPEFKFMSSQPQVYQFVKEDQPELYERVKQAIRDGRWEPEGGMWVEADCNLTGSEALVRQFLYGNEFFETEFGRRSRILWLPDVFGYSAALPQVLKKSHIDYFMTSKLSWSEFNKSPYDTFMWKGIDGSEVLTHFTPARNLTDKPKSGRTDFHTTYNAKIDPGHVMGGWKRFQQKGVDNHFLLCFGYGDGGGGVTDWMLENGRRMQNPVAGAPVVRQTFARDFFESLEERVKDNKRLPKWSGELYLEYHRGTYTSQARNKLNNRKAEIALRDLEFWLTKAADKGLMDYPQDALREIWRTVMTLQFHDVLPGSSIRKVYEDSDIMYADVFEKVAALKKQATEKLCAGGAGDLRLSNTLSYRRSDVVWFDGPEGLSALVGLDGTEYPVQKIGDKYAAFVTDMAPMSETPVWFKMGAEAASAISVDQSGFKTPFFTGKFDENMGIVSLYDKREQRELVKPGKALNTIVYYENRPHNYDAWDINAYYQEHSWSLGKPVSVEKISEGPVATVLRVKWQISLSEVTEDYIFYKDLDRVDFKAHVDWKEPHGLLKAHFPLDLFYNQAQYDIQWGNVTRATHKNTTWDVARFEVCMHKWLDVSEAGYGAALLNDCKYGCSVDENSVAISMLKSATEPDPMADQCEHNFAYSLYPHQGDFRASNVPAKAYAFNIPVDAIAAGGGKTAEAPVSFAAVDKDNVVIETVKKALHGEGTIIRMYECFGARTPVTLTLGKAPESASLTSMMEDDDEAIAFDGNRYTFTIKPYEIVTFRIK